MLFFYVLGCMCCFVSLFFVDSTGAINCLERLISKMTYYVSYGVLNPTHSPTNGLYTMTFVGVCSVLKILKLEPHLSSACCGVITYLQFHAMYRIASTEPSDAFLHVVISYHPCGRLCTRLRVSVCHCGVAIQIASGAYAPPVSKIHNIFGM